MTYTIILLVVLLIFYYIFFFSEKSVTPQTDEVAMSPASTDKATGNNIAS